MKSYFILLKFYLLSFGYRLVRFLWISHERFWKGKDFDLESVVEKGDACLKASFQQRKFYFLSYYPSSCLMTRLYDLKFRTPLVVSSFKSDLRLHAFWASLGMGGSILKTVRYQPHSGHDRPRLFSVRIGGQEHFVNSLGLPTQGVYSAVESFDESLFPPFMPIGWSLNGNDPQDAIKCWKVIEKTVSNRLVFFVEINVSCPNVRESDIDVLDRVHLILSNIRLSSDCVVGIKLSPQMSNDFLKEVAVQVRRFSRTYLNLGNTQSISQMTFSSLDLPCQFGGMSGPLLFNRTLEMVSLLRQYNLPIIATGGISNVEQIRQIICEGATLVGMATALVKDPFSIPRQLHFLESSLV